MAPFDVLPSESQWQDLTRTPGKRAAYEKDLYFREAWAEWITVCEGEPTRALTATAILCAKPDAVVGRRLAPMLAYVRTHGFAPFGVAGFSFTRHSMREVWRYDWDVYPADRLSYSTVWYTGASTLAFFLRDGQQSALPASVRLSGLKGNAVATKRTGTELRSALRPPNSVLNFVHVPDEPADIVRELGILFEQGERLALMRMIASRREVDAGADAAAAIASLEQRFAEHDLDAAAALQRMGRAGILDDSAVRYLSQCMAEGKKLSWHEICSFADPGRAGVDRWDLIAIASELIPLERPGIVAAFPEMDWRAPGVP